MKAGVDIPNVLDSQIASKVAAEVKSVGTAPKAPAWFGFFKKEARTVRHHDMETVRRGIAYGIVEERER